jgi:hypothetical protein
MLRLLRCGRESQYNVNFLDWHMSQTNPSLIPMHSAMARVRQKYDPL